MVVVLPDLFRGMGAWRNSTETQQSGHAPTQLKASPSTTITFDETLHADVNARWRWILTSEKFFSVVQTAKFITSLFN